MRIVLLRHGMPDVPRHQKMGPREFGRWLQTYDASGISPECAPSAAVRQAVQSCRVFVCSNLRRSLESAELLGVRNRVMVEAVFREAGLPHADVEFPGLTPAVWMVFFRMLWMLGYAFRCEPMRSAEKRASTGGSRLAALAKQNGSVALIGHGFMNRLIGQDLRRRGWQGPRSPVYRYWEYRAYRSEKP